MLLEVRNLEVGFESELGYTKAVNDLSFSLENNKTLCIVGESGSGKSVTSLSIMRLLDKEARIKRGEILFNGTNLLSLKESGMRNIRGSQIAMIFQEPMTSLNPSLTIGYQIDEALKLHQPNLSKKARALKVIESLEMVGIKEPAKRIKEYAFKLSGGQRQRIMIAMAMVCKPQLLIADEPTTALDVTIQAQVIELMKNLQRANNMAILFITHDLGVVSNIADDVIVMYKGQIVESGGVKEVLKDPRHPYTKALMGSIPKEGERKKRLEFVDENINYLEFKKEIR
ncbi:ABC transporter ATP-binding protein [Campylobacter sp. RM16188]|uniref:ABC transporter ATP-binding protein n=1 Tax=Campylobacter sp. RM16188 TaxID=1705725 RepID=UPI0015535012|nr:ABC transporter ATP-binding protein [Campylobacter sp. RM16188]